MKRYLLDSNIIISHTRGKKLIQDYVDPLACSVSYISIGEVIQGSKNKQEQQSLEQLLEAFTINYGSCEISTLALNLVKKHCLKDGVDIYDALIAATAIHDELILVTENIKHFNCLPHLELFTLSKNDQLL